MRQPACGVKVETFGEPVILSGDIEQLAANFLAREACGTEANPLRLEVDPENETVG
jgi:hypothetical protein